MQIQCVFFPDVNVDTDYITSCGDAAFNTVSIASLVENNPQWFIETDEEDNEYLCTITLPNDTDISAEFLTGQTPYSNLGESFVRGRPPVVR